MKVMVVHHDNEMGKALVERIQGLGLDVIEQRPRWPSYFTRAKEEQPDIAIVDCSTEPGHGREIAGYLGETGFTNRIQVYIVNLPEEEREHTVWRAPNAEIVTVGQLEKLLAAAASAEPEGSS